MTEHDTDAPLTEDEIAAIEAALKKWDADWEYNMTLEHSRNFGEYVDDDDVRRLVADWRRQQAELARIMDEVIYMHELVQRVGMHGPVTDALERIIAPHTPRDADDVDSESVSEHDLKWYVDRLKSTATPGDPLGSVAATVENLANAFSGASRFRVGQRVRQKADATPREGVVVRIDMRFPLLNGSTLPCANIETDEGETFWWALDYLEDAT